MDRKGCGKQRGDNEVGRERTARRPEIGAPAPRRSLKELSGTHRPAYEAPREPATHLLRALFQARRLTIKMVHAETFSRPLSRNEVVGLIFRLTIFGACTRPRVQSPAPPTKGSATRGGLGEHGPEILGVGLLDEGRSLHLMADDSLENPPPQ